MTAIALQRKAEILERVSQGSILREIAADLGVSKQAIHQALKDDPDYQAAKHEQAASMIEEAKIKTWAARDPIDIAHAREVTKFAFRYAESVDPARWGKVQDQAQGAVTIVIQRFGDTPVIEGATVHTLPDNS